MRCFEWLSFVEEPLHLFKFSCNKCFQMYVYISHYWILFIYADCQKHDLFVVRVECLFAYWSNFSQNHILLYKLNPTLKPLQIKNNVFIAIVSVSEILLIWACCLFDDFVQGDGSSMRCFEWFSFVEEPLHLFKLSISIILNYWNIEIIQ